MNVRTTILLFLAVLGTGLFIQFGERHLDSTHERRAAERLALRFDPDAVETLRIELPDSLYILAKTNQKWRLLSPVNAQADMTAVMRIIDTVANLRKGEIITAEEIRNLGIDDADYGFQSPRATLQLGSGPWSMTVLVGKDAPGAHQLYMKQEDGSDILVTDRDIMNVLPLSVLDIRDRHLFTGQPGGTDRIELQTDSGVWQASRDEQDQWMIERPIYTRGLNSSILQWLDGLYAFRVEDFIADSVAAGSLYGFDEPTAQVSLFVGSQSVPQVLKVGREADVKETTRYATIAGQDAVFTVSDAFLDWLRVDVSEFRDSRLLTTPAMNIGYIQMTEGEQAIALARSTQGTWEVISPKRFAAHDARMQQILAAWTGARALRFIDPPLSTQDLSRLNGVSRSIRFARDIPQLNGTERGVVTNLISVTRSHDLTVRLAGEPKDEHLYASPANQSYLMVLPQDLLGHFSVNPLDYRNPVVLSINPIDVRRITQVHDEKENSVIRTNQQFTARSAQSTANDEAVEGVLSLVARLIAVRLIEEDATHVSPYGLDNPDRMVIIGLSGESGINRVILLGGSAGTNETYAMIQGTDLVFTLTNEAAEALMNPVSALIAPEPAPAAESTE